jgi:rRNA processing protein Gar1
LEEPFYYVEVQVPTNGIVIIKGEKEVSSMTFEVYDADGKTVGNGSVKLTPINAPYKP